MPEELPRASKKFRAFLDGKEVAGGGWLTMTVSQREGALCTLGGKSVRIVEMVYDLTSGEIDEMHLEEVRE